ncbi:MAG: winged helix DNA-binding domain-containing protein [Chloroflexi bacterium]|nr:MAG: winged helix DNA-binding domain-containing protein [Chloroflexota bacterium]
MRKFTPDERRARLARRHHLAPGNRVTTATQVARDLVGLHSTDPATVFVAAWARMKNANVAGIEVELYDERSLLRVLVMRRTAFVLPPDLAAVALAACSRSVGRTQRRQLEQWIDKAGIALEESTFDAVAARGHATAGQVSSDVPLLKRRLQLAVGTNNEASVTLAPFVLRLLAVDGRLIRGRPRGGWLSTQWSWATTETWLGKAMRAWSIHDAQVELVRAWLKAFGPATVGDVRWWTGWTLSEVRRALTTIKPAEVDVGGATGIVLADDLGPTRRPEPFASLLPGLDPTVMGWAGRDWYLGEHRAALFDRSGNAGPTVWWDGRVVGGWAQRRNGEILIRLLEDVGRDARSAIESEADRLRTWLGETRRVMPRFSTPLVKELAAETTAPTPRSRRGPRQTQKLPPG